MLPFVSQSRKRIMRLLKQRRLWIHDTKSMLIIRCAIIITAITAIPIIPIKNTRHRRRRLPAMSMSIIVGIEFFRRCLFVSRRVANGGCLACLAVGTSGDRHRLRPIESVGSAMPWCRLLKMHLFLGPCPIGQIWTTKAGRRTMRWMYQALIVAVILHDGCVAVQVWIDVGQFVFVVFRLHKMFEEVQEARRRVTLLVTITRVVGG
mmetsp:Transcript_52239/g.86446  ORF Transcript_52239/g.86446 Transcript_52239/m.86446 type:complete len:206 (-) Transcript_52239:338-955(-)